MKATDASFDPGVVPWHRRRYLLPGALLCACLLASPAVIVAQRQQSQALGDELTSRMDDVRRRIEYRLDAYEHMLRRSAEHFAQLGRPATPGEWAVWESGVSVSSLLPEIDTIGQVEVLDTADRTMLEEALGARRLAGLRVVPAGFRDRYGAITHHSTGADGGRGAIGLDLYSRPALRQAMDRAEKGRLMVTTPLTRGDGLEALAGERAVLALYPVFEDGAARPGARGDADVLAGFVFVTVQADRLFEDIIAASAHPLFLRVVHQPSNGAPRELFSNLSQAQSVESPHGAEMSIVHGDGSWRVEVATTARTPDTVAGMPWWWVGTTGSVGAFSLLLALGTTFRRTPPSQPSALHATTMNDPGPAFLNRPEQLPVDGGGRLPDSAGEAVLAAGRSDRTASRKGLARHSGLEAAMNTAWAAIRDGLVIMDRRLRIVDVNPAFRKMSGFTRDELLGRTPRVFKAVDGDASAFRDMALRLKREGCWQGRSWNRAKSGSVFITDECTQSLRNRADELTGYVAVFTDITENVERERHLLDIVRFDPLTGLLNRAHLREIVVADIATAHLAGTKLAVFYIDLDRFKAVNDRLGHCAGDELLLLVSQRLSALAGPSDHVARAGGDEFILVLNNLLDEARVEDHAERVQAAIRGTYVLESNKTVYVSASIGVALYPRGGTDPEQLLRQADRAMYTAKDQGRDRYAVFDVRRSQQVDAQRRRVQRIAHALEHEEFVLYYQPKINLRTGLLVGAEALLRWNHPEEGIIFPDQFLPLVAGTSQGAAIDRWVIGEALRQIEKLRTAGRELQIAVNIDGAYLQQPGFLEQLRAQLDEHPNLPRHLLELEILESIALTDLETIERVIDQLHQLGVCVALDDFGTGYSSLTYLQKLPTDTLKIDKSFIIGMFEDEYSQSLVQSIIHLASTFERKVVAEGVETERHVAALAGMGCEQGQGYWIARPLPPDDFCSWIRSREEPPTVPDSAGKVVWLGR